jgi:hypothetical protein
MRTRERQILEQAVHASPSKPRRATSSSTRRPLPAEAPISLPFTEDAPTRAPQGEGGTRAGARDLGARLHRLWPGGALCIRARRLPRSLGAPRARAPRRAGRLGATRQTAPADSRKRLWPLACSCSTMQLRASPREESEGPVAEPMGCESFFEEHRSKGLRGHVPGHGEPAGGRGDHAGCVPAALGAMGARGRAGGPDRLPVHRCGRRGRSPGASGRAGVGAREGSGKPTRCPPTLGGATRPRPRRSAAHTPARPNAARSPGAADRRRDS